MVYRKKLLAFILIIFGFTLLIPHSVSAQSDPIDLNNASVEQLQDLPGINEKIAQEINNSRNDSPMTSTWDLLSHIPYEQVLEINQNNLATVNNNNKDQLEFTYSDVRSKPTYKMSPIVYYAMALVMGAILLLSLGSYFFPQISYQIYRHTARFSLRSRFTVISILIALGSGLIVWLLINNYFVPDANDYFDKQVEQRKKTIKNIWTDILIETSSVRSEVINIFKRTLRTQTLRRRSRGFSPVPSPQDMFIPFSRAVKLGSTRGVEIIFLDRRDESESWNFSPGIPELHRPELKKKLTTTFRKYNGSNVSSKTGLVNQRKVEAIYISDRNQLYLYTSIRNAIKNYGDIAVLLPISQEVLSHLETQTGAPMILTSGNKIISRSLWDGKPWVELPGLDRWEAEFLIDRLPQTESRANRRIVQRAVRELTKSRKRSVLEVHNIRRYFLELEPSLAKLFQNRPYFIDNLVPFTKVNMPINRIPDKPYALGNRRSILEKIIKNHAPSNEKASRMAELYSLLLETFPTSWKGDFSNMESIYGDWDESMTNALKVNLDTRGADSIEPINLTVTNRKSIDGLLEKLGIENDKQILDELMKFTGEDGKDYKSTKLFDIEHLNRDDAEILAGFIYQISSNDYQQMVFAGFPDRISGNDQIKINNRVHEAREAINITNRVSLVSLNDRTSVLQDVIHLHYMGYGAVGIASLFVFLALHMIVGFIQKPLEKLKTGLASVRHGDYYNRLPLDDGNDEFSEVADQFNEMTESLKHKSDLETRLRMYVPESIAGRLKMGRSVFEATNTSLTTCSIMFADIRNFSYISQQLPPEKIIEYLNEYFEIVVEEIHSTGGTIDKFIGDAILGVWGAPEFNWGEEDPLKEYANRAVRTAVQIQQRIHEFNQQRSDDKFNLSFGIGVTTGEVVEGHLGTKNRADWTIIGSDVNLSQRISDSAMPYRILISSKTYLSMDDSVEARELEPLSFKGFDRPMTTYALLWDDGHSGPLMVDEEMQDGWYLWADNEKKGPYHINDFVDDDEFGLDSYVAREDYDDWITWEEAAHDLKLWMIKAKGSISGPFTFDQVQKQNQAVDAVLNVQLRGDNKWRPFEEFL